jgi:hypothetical protein
MRVTPYQFPGAKESRLKSSVLKVPGVVTWALSAPVPCTMAPAGAEVTMLRVALVPVQLPLAVRLSALLNITWQGVGVAVGRPQGAIKRMLST